MTDEILKPDHKYLATRDYEQIKKDEHPLLISRLDSTWIRTNDTGIRLLEILQKPKSFQEVCDIMSVDFDLPVALIRESIEPFFRGALNSGFIREMDGLDADTLFKPLGPREGWTDDIRLMTIWLHVTKACNLKCYYCSVSASPQAGRKRELTLQEIEAIYENLPEGPQYKTVISGGEPFIRDDILDIIKICKSHGLTYLTTNGIIENQQVLMDSLAHLDELQISIDGPDAAVHEKMRGRGSFDKAMETLSLLKSSEYKNYWISTTATKHNLPYLTKMLRFAYTHKALGLYVGRLMPSGRSRNNPSIMPDSARLKAELDKLWFAYHALIAFNRNRKDFEFELHVARDMVYRTIFNQKFYNCGFGGCGTISVAHNGDVYPCSNLQVSELKMGNVRRKPFLDILTEGRAKYSELNVDTLPVCKECSVRYTCGGGCPALSYYTNGKFETKNPACAQHFENVIHWSQNVSPMVYSPKYAHRTSMDAQTQLTGDAAQESSGKTGTAK